MTMSDNLMYIPNYDRQEGFRLKLLFEVWRLLVHNNSTPKFYEPTNKKRAYTTLGIGVI